MLYGFRGILPLLVGLVFGVVISLVLFPRNDTLTSPSSPSSSLPSPSFTICPFIGDGSKGSAPDKQSSEDWQVVVKKMPPMPPNSQPQSPKVVRARFAATELGIREKLLVIILGQSSLTVALNASIGHHVPRLQLFVDIARIDADIASLPNLVPYRTGGAQHAHVIILNTIFNMTLHENYDWFYLIPDTTYVNPFELLNFVNHVNWNHKVAIGGISAKDNKCTLQAGILLSNPAMQSLIQQRHICNSIVSSSDHSAFEMCILHATNLSCVDEYQGKKYHWWQVDENADSRDAQIAIHDKVNKWKATSSKFNRSLCVSPLLSEADARALHEHFVNVEVDRIDREIDTLIREIDAFADTIPDGPTWPIGIAPYSKPPNRHQVPKWEFFTNTEIFNNEPNQNVRALIGDDKEDIDEVIAAARQHIEGNYSTLRATGAGDRAASALEFIRLQNGYRVFDAMRGMDYMVDLVYRNVMDGSVGVRRLHLSRAIASTQLLHQVPYVKEDTDLTIVIPVNSNDEVNALRRLLARHIRICQSNVGDSRQTRIVIAARNVDTSALAVINNDLVELHLRCKSSRTDTMLLLLKPDSHPIIAAAALDEAVDHFGQQMIYLLLSPHADIQREFLDRVRINTIKHFQIFFPMPFVEYNPQIVSASEAITKNANNKDVDANTNSNSNNNNNRYNNKQEDDDIDIDISSVLQRIHAADDRHHHHRQAIVNLLQNNAFIKSTRQLVVHKDRGHFDHSDFSVLSLYGVDYMRARSRLDEKTLALDLSSIFLSSEANVHIMRAIEPALRLRYHTRQCDAQLVDSDYARCLLSRRESFATKAQLANLLFSHRIRDAAAADTAAAAADLVNVNVNDLL